MSGQNLLLLGAVQQVISDPDFEYTTLLLPGNGTNGAQNNTFLDSSTNAFSITRNGNTTQGTFSPFSQTGWGNYFDGSGDYLSAPSNTALEILGGSFTIEFWMCMTSAQGNYGLVSKYGSGTGYGWLLRLDTTFIRWYTTATSNLDFTYSFAVGTWYHIAVVSNGTTGTIYVNGTAQGATFSTNGTQDTSTTVQIGRTHSLTNDFPGYISNLRIVKGTAVYTANFTPSTTPLTAITNTSLLTCQSNRFVDNSTNAFAITRNGDVSVQAFSPFNPTAAWSAATNGGSGYFDGSGDYLETPSDAAFTLGSSGDFTVECWVYATATPGNYAAFMTTWSDANTGYSNRWFLGVHDSKIKWYNDAGASAIADSSNIQLNTWLHVAAVRNSSTITLYINGTAIGTQTTSQSYTTNGTVKLGYSGTGGNYFSGYISNARVVKGTAVYTAAFTPPTAPLTAITNTSLLLNFTNAGIYDATSKNDLETVGNAQISTTQSKFGGSSMYFDGTGDYLFAPSSQNLNFRTGDFTIEGWIYLTSTADAYRTIMYFTHSSGSSFFVRFGNNTSYNSKFQVGIAVGTASDVYSISKSMTDLANGWHHFAFTRSGTTCRVFINGTQENVASGTNPTTFTNASFTNSTDINTSLGPEIGRGGTADTTFIGYINDLRVTRGYARYTASFTAPTAAFPVL